MPAATLDAPPASNALDALDAPLPSAMPAPKPSAGCFDMSFADLPNGFPDTLEMWPDASLSREQFFKFCQTNRDLRIEQDAHGKVIIMPPAGGETGSRNAEVTCVLGNWSVSETKGQFFDSSTGFILPNGATRSPDASWVLKTRLAQLTPDQKTKFLPLCPDFVIEIRSPSDALAALQDKMEEYRQNGARLGWLINAASKAVFIYRENQTGAETLSDPQTLSGEGVLPGFVLHMTDIWNPL